jgi:hypothetical protein
MTDLIKINEKILPVLLILNGLFLAVGIFYVSKSLLLLSCLLNIILIGTNLIIKKYAVFFQAYSQINGFANKLNAGLGNLNIR